MHRLDPEEALRRLGSVSDGATLRRICGPWPIRQAVRQGHILHLHRNRYALTGARDAHLAAGRVNGVVSHLSAALFWGWKVRVPPPEPEVAVPRGRKLDPARRAGIRIRWRTLAPDEVHRGAVTSRARTVADCARDLPLPDALSVADSALREGVVTRDELRAAAARLPRTGRQRALRVIGLADGRAANPFESSLRTIAEGVPGLRVVPQLQVAGIGHADLGDARLGLLIEADSYEFHAESAAFRYDIRRYTAMVRDGWTLVRFCWEDVMHRPEEVRAVLTDMVELLAPGRRTPRPCPDCPAA